MFGSACIRRTTRIHVSGFKWNCMMDWGDKKNLPCKAVMKRDVCAFYDLCRFNLFRFNVFKQAFFPLPKKRTNFRNTTRLSSCIKDPIVEDNTMQYINVLVLVRDGTTYALAPKVIVRAVTR